MSANFVQGMPGLIGASAGAGSATTKTASGGSFPSSTIAGNTLVCICYLHGANASVLTSSIDPPVTAGVTWVLVGQTTNAGIYSGILHGSATISMYYANNAP